MSRRDEAQRLWERAFNEGVPKPRQPCSVRVLGVRCVRPLRWPPPAHEAAAREARGQEARGQEVRGQAASGQAREEGVPRPSPGLSDSARATHAAPVAAKLPPPALVSTHNA